MHPIHRILVPALALGAILGATSCAPSPAPAPSATSVATPAPTATATPTATPTINSDAVEADKTLDAFFAQVKTDIQSYTKEVAGQNKIDATPEDVKAQLQKSFASSIAYVKPGSMTEEQRTAMLGTFSVIYLSDSAASISGTPENFTIAGNTATVRGGDLTVIINGSKLPSGADKKGGVLTLEKVDGKWLISGFDPKG